MIEAPKVALAQPNLLTGEEEAELLAPSPQASGLRMQALDGILALITGGELKPGDKCSENDLVVRFPGMSRTPIREALAVLASDGFIRQRPQVGFFVLPVRWAEVREILSLRLQVEALIASHLAQVKLGPAHDRLEAILQEQRGQTAPLGKLDTDFHVGLAVAAGFHTAARNIKSWRGKLQVFRAGTPVSAHEAEEIMQDHARMLAAINGGDASRAAAAVRRHFEAAAERLLRISNSAQAATAAS